ncbi:MAG: hypothetical protein QOJ03_2707, partial [Frankiaceae bacterium]|nr:hypothetical protein [Frankiaceae bacterium]
MADGLGVSAEHDALADAVSGFAAQAQLTAEARRAAESDADLLPASWSALAAQELLALPLDGSLLDVCVAVEALGRALASGPTLSTLIAATLIRRHGSDELRARVESGLRDGSFSVAVAHDGLLLGGASVSHVIVETGGRWQVVDATAVGLTSTSGIDPTRRLARATVPTSYDDDAGTLPALTGAEVQELTALLLSAEAAGVAAWCLATAVDYAKVREQFGRPIGQFQAVKHSCADMLAQVELARAAVWDAAGAYDDDTADAPVRSLTVTVAVAVAVEAAVECAKSCIQVLGGIGFTWEHDAHLYLRRALVARQLLGAGDTHRLRAVRLASGGARRELRMELPPEAENFRGPARAVIEGVRDLDPAAVRRALAPTGYAAPHLPAPYGLGAGPVQQLVIQEELGRS